MSDGGYDYGEDMGGEEDYYYDEQDDYGYAEEEEQVEGQHDEGDYCNQMEEEVEKQPVALEVANPAMNKNKVSVSEQQDIIDFLITDHRGPINLLLQQVEPLLLNKDEMQHIFLRIGKLLNEIKKRVQSMHNQGTWKFDKKQMEELNALIELTFRFLYIYQYSSLEDFIDKTVLLKIDFDKGFTKSILNLLLKADDFAESISFTFLDNLKKIFVFCLNPPEPYITHEEGILTNISNQLLETMGLEPTHLVFDTLILAYFSNPLRMSKVFTQNIQQVTSQLESYLQSVNEALQLKEQLLVLKMIQLLIFISSSDAKILQILINEELDRRLYDTVKFSDVSFIGNDKKQWSNDARLIQSIVILIKIILSGKKKGDQRFAQTLLDDFLFLINQNRFNFVYSIIVPILTSNDTQFIPFCLHKTWNIDSVKQFNDYLKDIAKKGTNANQILTDSRVPTDLFDERQREYFYNTFLKTGGNQDIKGVWRKVMQIDRDNPIISIDKTIPALENEPQTLFIFNCTYQGTTIKYGVYVKNKIESFKNQQKNSVFDKSNKNLRATSNAESFFFYMDESRMFHVKSTQRKSIKTGPKNMTEQQDPFPPNMKDLIRIEYSGMSFILDEEIAIYINFGNIDLSKFDIPFSKLNLEDAFIKNSVLNTEEIYLESAEVWHLEQENANAKMDSYLQMFSQKEDLQSIYISYLKYFRLEKISILPNYITLQSFVDNFVNSDYQNRKVVKQIASKLDDNLSLSQTIKSLEYIYDGTNTNKTLDLIIPCAQANLLKLPFEEELTKLYEVNKHAKNLIMEVFQNNCEGVTKIIQIMEKEAQKRYSQNLIIFFFDAQKFLTLPQFANHLIIQKDFFKILLQLLFTQEFADTKVGIQNYHQAVYLLFKSLRRLFKYDKSGELRQFCFRKNILQDILSKFEIYNGNLSKKYGRKKLEEKAKAATKQATNEVFQDSYGNSGGSTKLSQKGVGYGAGSSDTSWMKNYSSGYSTQVSEDAMKNQQNQYGYGYSAPVQNNASSVSSFVLGHKKKVEDNLVYNDPSTIKTYLGQDFISKILKQLSACLEQFLDFDYKFEITTDLYNKIKLSTLNPILMNVFDTNSLLDSTKRASFFKPIMYLFQNIAKNDELLDFFIWTDDYLEKMEEEEQSKHSNTKMQIEQEGSSQKCLYSLLSSLRDQADFFEKNMFSHEQNDALFDTLKITQAQKDEKKKEAEEQKSMIQMYLKTFDIVEKALKQNEYILVKEVEEKDNSQSLSQFEAGKMHIEQFYTVLLKPLSVQGAPTVVLNHHYSTYFNTGTPSALKMQRLIKEIADLTHSLPMTSQSAIFVRYDTSRMDVMKSLIFGAEDTPYAHGAFVFDMFFDDTYPANSPKVNLATTGAGKIRFNPNLYHCGKVCLSLLGTWRGSSNENWNPNISTILQILVSIQAIVMSEYVYFNEPGYEGQAGSSEGERLNRGYQNIVRIGNIRHAMIDQIKNPPPEFREIIMMSFFLKKDIILKECNKWYEIADQPADYTGLVSSHNSSFCTELNGSKYKQVLKKEIDNLKKCFEDLKMNVSTSIKFSQKKKKVVEIQYNKPSILFESQETLKPKVQAQNQMQDEGKVVDVNNVNMDYDEDNKHESKEINVDNANITNRWSRYIGALGIDAVKKQANANVLLVGLNHVGVEIAKNIVLSGVKRFSIIDQEKVTLQNIIGQFFLGEEDIGKYRSEVSLKKLSALNEYVSCDSSTVLNNVFNQASPFYLENYSVIILTNTDLKTAVKINQICREKNIGFILVQNYSVYSRTFCDFGKSFTVIDRDGEQAQEYLIKSISQEANALITLQNGVKHSLQDGDVVELREVINQSNGKTFNLHQFKIKVKDNNSFYVGDTQAFGTYSRNGIAKHIKQPLTLSFKSLEQNLENPLFEDNLLSVYTEEEIASRNAQNICFNIIDAYVEQYKGLPRAWNIEDATNFYKLAYGSSALLRQLIQNKDEKLILTVQSLILKFAFTCSGYIPSQGAILGGVVAQEIVKSITKKWVPINQIFMYSSEELSVDLNLQEYIQSHNAENIRIDQHLQNIAHKYGLETKNDKYDSLRVIFGEETLHKISTANTFIVGAGAIGCELIKNLSMIGFGRKGSITLTDPDIIENSNLNRQFLFREKHIRQPKSSVAAAAAIFMNKDLKNSITARLDKVYEQTEHIFNDSFFQHQSIVLNALDNVQARKYMDVRCIQNRRALIDSGTLGPKGHVQVIIPQLTETYGSQQDPQEEGDIPHCTLKMFPEQTLHCVEWARDKFGRMFMQKPQSLQRVLEAFRNNSLSSLEEKTLKEGLNALKKYPKNFDDCLLYAYKKFYKVFNHNIQSLLHLYPHNHKNKDGSFFWTLPKRPPNAQQFDPANDEHMNFVISCAALYANVFNIKIDMKLKEAKSRASLAQIISKMPVPHFKIDESKLKSMKQDIAKEKEKEDKTNQMEIEQPKTQNLSPEQLIKEIKTICSKFSVNKIIITPQEFEKDVDDNYHVDFLHSMTNCRAINYTLENMSWIDVKLKAGKIIPALVTTTSIVAGLQIIETIKILKEVKPELFKNAFLNLSLPMFVQPEPQRAESFKLNANLSATVWDRWEIKVTKENDTLEKLFAFLIKNYKLIPHDVFQGNKPIYIEQLMLLPNREQEKNDLLSTKLIKILELKNKDDSFIDINVTFTTSLENPVSVKGAPPIRLFF